MAICPLCKSEYHPENKENMTDEEKFLDFWTPTLGLEAAKKSWAEKQELGRQKASYVISDIQGYVSQVDGSWIDSRSKHKEHLKKHRMVEVGNDVPMQHKEVSVQNTEQRKRAIAEQVYQKLRY